MSFDDIQLKKEVDNVFDPQSKKAEGTSIEWAPYMMSPLMSDSSGGSITYKQSDLNLGLTLAHDRLAEEDYNKVAEAVAKDERLTKYLPSLALQAMELKDRDSRAPFLENHYKVDTDRDESISKRELLQAAQDTEHFDPVYRKGLTFAAENFDKFRSFDQHDGIAKYVIAGEATNQWHISDFDLRRAERELEHYPKLPAEIKANQFILDNFDKIDSNNGSGKITNKETMNFLSTLCKSDDICSVPELEFVMASAPQTTYTRTKSTSEELTKDDYQKRIDGLKANQDRIAKLWGW